MPTCARDRGSIWRWSDIKRIFDGRTHLEMQKYLKKTREIQIFKTPSTSLQLKVKQRNFKDPLITHLIEQGDPFSAF